MCFYIVFFLHGLNIVSRGIILTPSLPLNMGIFFLLIPTLEMDLLLLLQNQIYVISQSGKCLQGVLNTVKHTKCVARLQTAPPRILRILPPNIKFLMQKFSHIEQMSTK